MKNVARNIEAWLGEQTRRLFVASPDFADADTIHDMRVASRRLRVGLEFFAENFDARELDQLLRHVNRLADALGAVRALDVNLELLRKKSCRNIDGTLTEQNRLLREREKLRPALEILYRAMITGKIPSRIETLVARRRGQPDARASLGALRRDVRRSLDRFDEKPASVAFHKLRIAAKKYRYGLEIATAVFGADAEEKIVTVKELQERMGACHDVEVLMERLPVGPLKKYFAKEHRRRYEAVEKFLDDGRRWVKKLKLEKKK
jgi:CHAD domain-containing protein